MLTYDDGALLCDGVAVGDLARQVATPFFLFSEAQLRQNYHTLLEAFSGVPGGVSIDYCLKTNYEMGILTLLLELGAGVMVTCGWELQHALRAGFPPARITYHAPYKSDEELAAAVEAGVGLIHVYSADELQRLARVAADHGVPTSVSIRIPAPGSWLGRRVRGWYADRLGVPPDLALELLERAAESEWLRPRGLSVHVGTQLARPAAHLRAVRKLMSLTLEASARGVTIDDISLGGGWPSDTLQPINPRYALTLLAGREPPALAPRLEPMARRVAAAFRQAAMQAGLPRPPLVRLEPGRGIVGAAGLLVTRVIGRRGRWLFVDGSHNLLPESGLVGQREVRPGALGPHAERHRWHVSGRTLNTADVMAVGAVLPDVEDGDLLVFRDAGAYSLSRATRYAGTIPDAYLLTPVGTLQQIRRKDTYDDIVGPMVGVGQRAGVLE